MPYPDESDVAFWMQREAQERANAEKADPRYRHLHEELANSYASLIAQAMSGQRDEA